MKAPPLPRSARQPQRKMFLAFLICARPIFSEKGKDIFLFGVLPSKYSGSRRGFRSLRIFDKVSSSEVVKTLMANLEDIKQKIEKIETDMSTADFWIDKNKAQSQIRELESLKDELSGIGKYDRGGAVMTIFSGAGGDDAEDFSRILLEMYMKFFDKQKWSYSVVHKNENDHGGYRNITLDIGGKSVYGTLKNESGVHRLVRISPFNASQKRHTSFSMVEVIPKFEKIGEIKIPPEEIKVTFSKS